jgi:hypothetical protein
MEEKEPTFRFKAEGKSATLTEWSWPNLRDLYERTMAVIEELEGNSGDGFHYPRFFEGSVGCDAVTSENYREPCNVFRENDVSSWPSGARQKFGKLSTFMNQRHAHLKVADATGEFRLIPLKEMPATTGLESYEELTAEIFRVGGKKHAIELRAEGRVIPRCVWPDSDHREERVKNLAEALYDKLLVFGKVTRGSDGRIEEIVVDDYRLLRHPPKSPEDQLAAIRSIRELWPDDLSPSEFIEEVRGSSNE